MSWFTLQKLKSKDQAARCDAVREIAREGDVEHMLPMLSDASAMVRVVTIKELTRLRATAAIEPLGAALQDSDINVRKAAAEGLAEINDPTAIPPLLAALGDINREVRACVIAALVRFGPSALEPVIGALGDPDDDARHAAVNTLVQAGFGTVPALLDALHSSDAYVRQSVCECLGKLGGTDAIPTLYQLLLDENSRVRNAAAQSLQLLHWKPLEAGEYATVMLAIGKYKEAVAHGIAAIPALTALLGAEEIPVRMTVVKALAHLRLPESIDPLVSALSDNDAKVRRSAAELLFALGWRPQTPLQVTLYAIATELFDSLEADNVDPAPLLKLLHDVSPDIRRRAALTMGRLQLTAAVPELLTSLQDGDDNVAANAATALGLLGAQSATTELLLALASGRLPLQQAAAGALGKLCNASALAPLSEMLTSPTPALRASVIRALGDMGAEEKISALIDALTDVDMTVHTAAQDALHAIGVPALAALGAALCTPDDLKREMAALALEKFAKDAVPVLISALQGEHAEGRRVAASILGRMGWEPTSSEEKAWFFLMRGDFAALLDQKEEAVGPLIIALKDRDPAIRALAANALGDIKDPRAAIPLTQAFREQDMDVRKKVAQAIISVMGADAYKPLVAALDDSLAYVRKEAAYALVELHHHLAVVPLIASLKDPIDEVRIAVSFALGKYGDTRAVDPLIDRLRDANPEVRSTVARALGEIGDTRARDPLLHLLREDNYRAVREAAAEALGVFDN